MPGALIGALPPLIGWSAAGRNPLDMEILAVAFLLFVGQMPHYWLLLIKVGHEFHKAGLPVITSLLDTTADPKPEFHVDGSHRGYVF